MNDPLRPGLDRPTPADVVARLTIPQREERVRFLIEQADWILETAKLIHGGTHRFTATCVLFSGGNDSTVLAHLMRKHATHAIHCNTTIGIEATRQFVRDTCAAWDLPLIEEVAPTTYRELVLDQAFPGAGHHFKMFQRLKERGLRQARRKLVANPRKERVLYLAGRRRQESSRRANIPLFEREGSIVWASPIAMWTKPDMTTYRMMNRDRYHTTLADAQIAEKLKGVPVNEVSDILHMSGECLCGSFSHPGELEEIEMWYPEVAAEIRALEAEVLATGKFKPERCKWGWNADERGSKAVKPPKSGPLCTSCDARYEGGEAISVSHGSDLTLNQSEIGSVSAATPSQAQNEASNEG